MSIEKTLTIIKPDAYRNKHIGEILSRFENANLKIVALKVELLTIKQVESFYQEHKDRPFFSKLVQFMTSGPVVIGVLEGEQAIMKNRTLLGHTDPKKADSNTIRADFALSIDENAVHGSDSPTAAEREIKFFFNI